MARSCTAKNCRDGQPNQDGDGKTKEGMRSGWPYIQWAKSGMGRCNNCGSSCEAGKCMAHATSTASASSDPPRRRLQAGVLCDDGCLEGSRTKYNYNRTGDIYWTAWWVAGGKDCQPGYTATRSTTASRNRAEAEFRGQKNCSNEQCTHDSAVGQARLLAIAYLQNSVPRP